MMGELKPRWPRGRYNGQRIVGLRITVAVDVTVWDRVWGSILYGRCWALGPVRVWIAHEFESAWRAERRESGGR